MKKENQDQNKNSVLNRFLLGCLHELYSIEYLYSGEHPGIPFVI